MDNIPIDFVRNLIESCQKTTAQALESITEYLRSNGVQNMRGISIRSLERFMAAHGITRRLTDDTLDEMAKKSIGILGGSTGAKMVTGYIRSRMGRSFGRNRVAKSLRRIDPEAAVARHRMAHRLINPKTYFGRYFGYNLHMDQNEKLVMFDVTLVVAMDGFSGMVVGGAVMTKKNNMVIYEKVYRSLVLKFGLWRRVIVDYGKEFFLTLYMHMNFHRQMEYVDQTSDIFALYKQTQSTRNNRIERLWGEVNQQVVYPIKDCISDLIYRDILDVNEDFHIYSVGEVIRPLVHFGLQTWIRMWNHHIVPKRGRPTDLARDSHTLQIDHDLLIDGEEAANEYRNDGGSLTDEHDAAGDLLEPYPEARERRNRLFWDQHFPVLKQRVLSGEFGNVPQRLLDVWRECTVIELLFGATTNRFFRPLQEAVLLHIRVSLAVYNDVLRA